MQIKSKYNWLKHMDFMIVDAISLVFSFILSYWLKFGDVRFVYDNDWLRLLLVITLLNIISSLFMNPYSGILRRAYYQEVRTCLRLSMINLVMVSVLIFLFKMGIRYSREVIFVTYGLYFLLSMTFKFVWKKLLVSRKIIISTTRLIPLFIYADSGNIEEVLNEALAGDFQLYDVKGIYLTGSHSTDRVSDIPVITSGCVDFILENNINDVLVSIPMTDRLTEDCKKLAENGISIHINVESSLGFQTEDQFITNVGVYKTLTVSGFSFTPRQMVYLWIKRIADIFFGLVGVVILVPVTLGIKLANLCVGDRGKVFYRHERVGKYGKPFRIWKYRSMVTNADDILRELLKQEEYRKQWEKNQKLDNDPRITKVGRFIRRTSIDELPQLINVLTGEMSLVGPRPLIQGELEAHHGLKLYQMVKPGITGWWGCNGRSNIDYRERLELEYYYVKNNSLYLDILCIVRTMLAVLKKNGAQ